MRSHSSCNKFILLKKQCFRTEAFLSEFFGRIWDGFKGAKFSSQIRPKIVWNFYDMLKQDFFPTNFARISLKKQFRLKTVWNIATDFGRPIFLFYFIIIKRTKKNRFYSFKRVSWKFSQFDIFIKIESQKLPSSMNFPLHLFIKN